MFWGIYYGCLQRGVAYNRWALVQVQLYYESLICRKLIMIKRFWPISAWAFCAGLWSLVAFGCELSSLFTENMTCVQHG